MIEQFGQYAASDSATLLFGNSHDPWHLPVELFFTVFWHTSVFIGQWLPLNIPAVAPASWIIAGFPLSNFCRVQKLFSF